MPAVDNLDEGLDELRSIFEIDITHVKDPFSHLQNQYSKLESGLHRAKAERVINPLPAGEAVADDSRKRTLRDRLINLGYLKLAAQQEAAVDDRLFEAATLAFQQEAGITGDGWAGVETWTALQELVSFETPTNLPRWFDQDQPKKVLERATLWRLFALGLSPSRPSAEVDLKLAVQSGLNHFIRVLEILGWQAENLQPSPSKETLSLLFDQDALILGLSRVERVPDKASLLVVHSYIVNIAKVELWMLGFEIKPDGHGKDPMIRSDLLNNRFEFKNQTSSLFKAISDYWVHHENRARSNVRAQLFVSKHFHLFFKQLHLDTTKQSEQGSEEVYKHFNQATSVEQRETLGGVWNSVKKMGARLWDGLKRIWNWLVNLAEKVLQHVENIVRIGYAFIAETFSVVTISIEVMVSSVDYLFQHNISSSAPDHAIVRHDLDFDFITMVNNHASPEKVNHISAMLTHKSAGFVLAAKIIAMLADLVKGAITKSFTGYFMLIIGLLNLYRDVAELFPSLQAWKTRDDALHASSLVSCNNS